VVLIIIQISTWWTNKIRIWSKIFNLCNLGYDQGES